MSDKSVGLGKVLDWPNHDDYQDKPPRFGHWTEQEQEEKRLEEEIAKLEVNLGKSEAKVHTCNATCGCDCRSDECTCDCYCDPLPAHYEQNQDPSQQLNPTEDQNVTPFSQGQFIPTATYGPQKGDEAGTIDPEVEADLGVDVACPNCQKESLLGPMGFEQVLKDGKWVCPECGYEEPIGNEEDLEWLLFGTDITEETDDETMYDPFDVTKREAKGIPWCEFHDKAISEHSASELEDDEPWDVPGYGVKYEGPLTDPREREKTGDAEKEPGEDLSPEAQKIAGRDPASIEAKQKEKPKLEVDVNQKIAILGKTGSGKSNLVKVLMTDILPDYKFVVLDAIGNLTEYDGQPNVDYHQTNPSDEADVDQIIYSALEKGDCMVVIDEVDRYNSKKGTMLNELVNVGRNYGVGGIFAARRTASIDKDILANSAFIFTFQHILPQDLDVLMDWFAQPEDTFRDLQEFEAILFKDGDQIWSGKVPEMPTTTPSKKPMLPKKPKGKGKGPEQKGGEPTPSTGGGGGQPTGGEGSDTKGQGMPAEKEPKQKGPSDKSPELTPADEGEKMASEKNEARYADEAPFVCPLCNTRYKYESDWSDHLVKEHSYA